MLYIERQQSNGYLYSFYAYADSISEALECLGQIGDDHDYESGMVFLIRRYAGGPILAKLELRHESREEFACGVPPRRDFGGSREEEHALAEHHAELEAERGCDMEPIDHTDPGDLLALVDHPGCTRSGGW